MKRKTPLQERVRELADRLHLPHEEMCRRAGLPPRIINTTIDQGHIPRPEKLTALARFGNVTVAWLLGEEGDTPREGRTFPVYNTGAGPHWVAADEEVAEEGTLFRTGDGFRVRGDSMEPIARDGQTVLVERGVEARDGDLAIVEKSDGVRAFKRVRFKGKQVILESVNPAYPADLTLRSAIVRMTRVWGVKF